ncbi:MAG: type I secretion system permease/ATPase [Alphaproteobacteria bacterium]|nr:type I secretion system permease/ATPase [Alphaproteobacteria bacterium]
MTDSTTSQAKIIDPLLECLVFLTSHYGRTKSAQALTAGLAYGEGNMGPALFCEAAQRINLKAQIVRRDRLKKIPAPVLPAVLILEDEQACVLLNINEKEHSATIWSPETGSERSVQLTDLKQSYQGYAIYVHPKAEFVDADAPHAKDTDRHWFWGAVFENKLIYGRVALAAILINLFGLTGPIFIMNVYNRVIPNNAIETGWVLGIGALTVFLFDFIMRNLRGYFIDLAGRRIDVMAGRRIYDQLLNMKLAERPTSSGSFANMLRDFDSVRDFVTSATLTTVIDLPFTFLYLFVIWMLGGPIAFILAVLIFIVFFAGMLLQIPLKALVRKSTKSAEAKHGLLIETIHGLETIKAVGADGRMRERYSRFIAENAGYSQKSRFVSGLGVNISMLVQQTASIFAVLLGMYLVAESQMSVGALIACVLLGGRAITPIGQMANLMSRYHGAKTALKTLNDIMNKPVERPSVTQFLHRPDLKGKITFRKVSFVYPNTDRKVLDGASFIVQAGENVGIIGRIGSGKSTMARLSMGLYDPTEGTILLDDTDYRQIDPADLRRNVAYIAQDVVLFNGTVRENIAMSVPHASEEEILRAATEAGVHGFISEHPMGYDAPVGERGEGLSGGQRQCVALARAMLLQPNIYICDEPTNAMDIQSETTFVKHIEEQTKDKTLILITHRQHLLSLVERLILVDHGRVIMDGKRDQVLQAIAAGKVQVPNSPSSEDGGANG